MDYLTSLANFSLQTHGGDIPDRVVERARMVLLDTIGAIVGARALPQVRRMYDFVQEEGNGLAFGAWADGVAGVFLELDEGCAAAKGHPGVHVVPAALAAGASTGSAGRDILETIAVGYEVAARLGAATTLRSIHHPHGTWGTFGAVAAAGRLHKLSHDEMVRAFRIASTLLPTTNYSAAHEGAEARNLWSGVGVFQGLTAVQLARAGFGGPKDGVTTVLGQIMGERFEPDVAVEELGNRWFILENYFKLYASCRHTHASVDALRNALGRAETKLHEITSIEVWTYGRAVETTGHVYHPQAPLSAKFSLPYILASYLHHGRLDHDVFEQPNLYNGQVRETSEKVTVKEDPFYTQMLPKVRASRVRVTFEDGVVKEGEALGSSGDPQHPLTFEDLVHKFRSVVTPVLPPKKSDHLVDTIRSLEELENIRLLTELIRRHEAVS